jgi:hypothetical protein
VGSSCTPSPCGTVKCDTHKTKSACETAKCFWYPKWFWEEPTCHAKEQDYFEDYKPFIIAGAVIGGATVLALLLRKPKYPSYY